MIALRAIPPEPQPRHVERGRTAARRRMRRAQRRGYVAFVRVVGSAVVLAMPLMLYVMLTANITSLNYKLAHVQAQKAELLAASMRAEDRIAKLESRERLSVIAARLGMHDPHVYAVVALPAPEPAPERPHGVALLGAMNQWLTAAGGDLLH
jgi:cell division protein FtsB